jgi:hypothetical protein
MIVEDACTALFQTMSPDVMGGEVTLVSALYWKKEVD